MVGGWDVIEVLFGAFNKHFFILQEPLSGWWYYIVEPLTRWPVIT